MKPPAQSRGWQAGAWPPRSDTMGIAPGTEAIESLHNRYFTIIRFSYITTACRQGWPRPRACPVDRGRWTETTGPLSLKEILMHEHGMSPGWSRPRACPANRDRETRATSLPLLKEILMYDYGVSPRAASARCMSQTPRLVNAFPQRIPSPFMERMVYNRANPAGQNVLPLVPGDTIPLFDPPSRERPASMTGGRRKSRGTRFDQGT
jgi:hypothetical protein